MGKTGVIWMGATHESGKGRQRADAHVGVQRALSGARVCCGGRVNNGHGSGRRQRGAHAVPCPCRMQLVREGAGGDAQATR
jgi:hypothetical protein